MRSLLVVGVVLLQAAIMKQVEEVALLGVGLYLKALAL